MRAHFFFRIYGLNFPRYIVEAIKKHSVSAEVRHATAFQLLNLRILKICRVV